MGSGLIRHPAVAGTFYPADPQNLSRLIDTYLSDADARIVHLNLPRTPPKAIIVPHAGYIYSGSIAGSGYALAQKFFTQKNPKILLIGLSHFVLLNGAAISKYEMWETPLGRVKSKNLLKEISENPRCSAEDRRAANNILKELEEAHTAEHSLEVQLPFLQTIFRDFTIYPIAIGDVDPKKLAETLAPFAAQENVIIIVSSDLSHYLPYAQAQKIDRASIETILKLDTENAERKIDACNKTGILTLMHLAKKLDLRPYLLDYRNSGDTAGDKSAVVGYASIALWGRG